MKVSKLQERIKAILIQRGIKKQYLAHRLGIEPYKLSRLLNDNVESDLQKAYDLVRKIK